MYRPKKKLVDELGIEMRQENSNAMNLFRYYKNQKQRLEYAKKWKKAHPEKVRQASINHYRKIKLKEMEREEYAEG